MQQREGVLRDQKKSRWPVLVRKPKQLGDGCNPIGHEGLGALPASFWLPTDGYVPMKHTFALPMLLTACLPSWEHWSPDFVTARQLGLVFSSNRLGFFF